MNYRQIVNVRIFHASPLVPGVDVFLNDRLVVENLQFRQATAYLPLQSGQYNVKLYNTVTGELLLSQNLPINENRYLTIIALADEMKLGLMSLPDRTRVIPVEELPSELPQNQLQWELPSQQEARKEIVTGSALVRFVHLSPTAPSIDVLLDQNPLFADLIYKEATSYVEMVPNRYLIRIRNRNTGEIILNEYVTINDQEIKTIYLTGLLDGSPKLELIVLNDGQ